MALFRSRLLKTPSGEHVFSAVSTFNCHQTALSTLSAPEHPCGLCFNEAARTSLQEWPPQLHLPPPASAASPSSWPNLCHQEDLGLGTLADKNLFCFDFSIDLLQWNQTVPITAADVETAVQTLSDTTLLTPEVDPDLAACLSALQPSLAVSVSDDSFVAFPVTSLSAGSGSSPAALSDSLVTPQISTTLTPESATITCSQSPSVAQTTSETSDTSTPGLIPGLKLPPPKEPKRRPGRKPGSSSILHSVADGRVIKTLGTTTPQIQEYEVDETTLIRRYRNNLAAKRCRQKKLDRITELEEEVKRVMSERDELRIALAKREAEVRALREMLRLATSTGESLKVGNGGLI